MTIDKEALEAATKRLKYILRAAAKGVDETLYDDIAEQVVEAYLSRTPSGRAGEGWNDLDEGTRGVTLRLLTRPDGGMRVWSPELRGLILSGADAVNVAKAIPASIDGLLAHNGQPLMFAPNPPVPDKKEG